MDRRASYMSNTTLPSFLSSATPSLSPPTLYSGSNASVGSISSNESDISFDIIAEFPLISLACGLPMPPSQPTTPTVKVDSSLKPPPIPMRSKARPKPRPVSMMESSKPSRYRESTDFTDLFTRPRTRAGDHSRDSSFLSMSSEHSADKHSTDNHTPSIDHLQPESILRSSTSSPHLNAGFSASSKPRAKSPPKHLRFADEHSPVTYKLTSKTIPTLTVEPPSPPAWFDLPSFVPFSPPPRKEAPVKRLWRTLSSVGKKTQNSGF